jgi:predicted porin
MRRMLLRGLAVAGFAISWAFLATITVLAADLKGGGCCADLEERVAELEATYAKKGNRKMTVTIYGQVNKALLYHDAFEPSTGKSSKGVVVNSTSPTMLGVTGTGKISPSWTAGYRLELGINEKPAIIILDDQVSVRHAAAWLDGPVGKFTVGRTSMATDGVGEVTVANTLVASKLLSLEPMSTNVLFGVDLPYDGPRRDVIRYDSPAMAGFIVSASYSSGAGVSLLGVPVAVAGDNNAYDISVRYAGEFGGFRIAAAAGVRDESYVVPLIPLPIPTTALGRDKVYVASASVMHMGTGLFASIAAGLAKAEFGPGGPDHQTFHGQAGWEKNITGLGATTIFAEYAQFKADGLTAQPNMIGVGLVQRLDAAAMDLYLSGKQYDFDGGGDKVNVIMLGTRIQF